MSDEARHPVIRMRGAGYYSANTQGARLVIDSLAPLVAQAIGAMELGGPAPFAIADYGAADGGTSIGLHRTSIEAIRARAPDKPVTLTYTDLPHNDFSALFRRVHGILPGYAEEGLQDLPAVFTFASGASFYSQIFPDASLSLGFSATAMHWLSGLPATLADHVHAIGAQGEARDAFRAQALADWERILLLRARELAPGGRLVVANFCENEAGHYLGYTGAANMHDNFARHWRALLHAGFINPGEFRRATFAQYYKTMEEFRAPFADPSSPVRQAGLTLERAWSQVTPCPYAARFREHGDAAAFARAYVPTLRSWSESTFAGALEADRTAEDRQDIIDRFYAAYEGEVATNPEAHAMDYVHCFMLIAKHR
jgi:hypothetical protein